jgi:hypothetical protein
MQNLGITYYLLVFGSQLTVHGLLLQCHPEFISGSNCKIPD